MNLREIEKEKGIVSAREENGLVIVKTRSGEEYKTNITRRHLEELKALNPGGLESRIAGLLELK